MVPIVNRNLAEPLTFHVIQPFAPQLMREIINREHGNESQVGFYIRILHCAFFLAETCTVLHWSRVSDHIGRKPVFLCGVFGLSLSMYCLGLSTTFRNILLSRILCGALNGNIGVIKSSVAELADSSNMSTALAYLSLSWTTGFAIGPLIGGVLSRPADRFPKIFGNNQFLKTYPYFLPSAIPATFSLLVCVVTILFLEETLPAPMTITQFLGLERRGANCRQDTLKTYNIENPGSLRSLLTYDLVVAAGNYAMLALLDMSFRAVLPVFFSTPIHFGGLGLSPPVVGKILFILGMLNGLFQICFFPRLNNRLGTKTVFLGALMCALPAVALFPVINMLARYQGYSYTVWAAVGAQIVIFSSMNLTYSAVFMFITAASPSRASFGATNGLCQVTVSFMRAIGPALINSIYSLSIKKGYLGGYLVYYILLLIGMICLYIG